MRNKSGFSLVELLVSIIVASILILTIGVLSGTANSSFNKLNSEQQIYNDISYGFKLMQNRVRVSTALSKVAMPTGTNWRSDKFIVDNAEFGIYLNGSNRDFVFIPDFSDETTQEKILSVPGDTDTNLTMSINCGCTRASPTTYTCADPGCSSTPQSATVVLKGTKDNIPLDFDMETTVVKRN